MKTIKSIMIHFSNGLEVALSNLINSLDNREINNDDISGILDNEKDEILFTETVDYLKQHRNEKSKDIYLSDKRSLTVSIE
jgi:hypothetical protein